jgi:GNAT superfamily N-acetyltransferase
MIKRVTNKEEIYIFLKRDKYQFAYHIGDLDDFFFNDCTFFGLYIDNILKELILLYSGLSLPTLLVFGYDRLSVLLKGIVPSLPSKFFCHYQKGLENILLPNYEMEYHGTHIKMKYTGMLDNLQTSKKYNCIRLTGKHTNQVLAFYDKTNPNTYFEPFMLETDKYYGILEGNEIISIAGVHVHSTHYNISVIGNVATDPIYRGLGYATSCVLTLLKSLDQESDNIGLNVKADNFAAIRLYEKLGFIHHSEYEEAFLSIKT